MDKQQPSPAVVAKKEREAGKKPIITLSTGVRVKLLPVAASLITDVTGRIEDPPVPIWHNPDKDRDEENPNDPAYLRACQQADTRRGLAAVDALVLFGVELVDGMPEDDRWLTNLRHMERLGHLDLSGYDLGDAVDQEFLYKRYMAVASPDLGRIMSLSGLKQEDIRRAERSFRGDGEGPAD